VTSSAVPIFSRAEPRRLTRDEYDRLASSGFFDGERVELIRGMVIQMSPIGPKHADPVDFLGEAFATQLVGRARVRVQQPFLVDDDSEPEPDIALVPPGRYRDRHPNEAFLIVEVADSSLEHDRVTKAELYSAAGAPEYWVVDVEDRSIEVHDSIRDGSYGRVRRFGLGAELRPSAFPDITIRLAELFPG
jgi:Uma2 family endonuclease